MFLKQKLQRIQSGEQLDHFDTDSKGGPQKNTRDNKQAATPLPPLTKFSSQLWKDDCPRYTTRKGSSRKVNAAATRTKSQEWRKAVKGTPSRSHTAFRDYEKPLPPLPQPDACSCSSDTGAKTHSSPRKNRRHSFTWFGIYDTENGKQAFDCSEDIACEDIYDMKSRHMDDQPPDGGTLAWLHVLAGFLIFMNAQ